MKKNAFFTFCLACFPGAGQMYYGYLKRGASYMLLFWGIIGAMAMFNLVPLGFVLPVVWFYAFFDTYKIRNMTLDERLGTEDGYFMDIETAGIKKMVLQNNRVAGGVLIFLGAYMLYYSFLMPYLSRLLHTFLDNFYWVYELLRDIPSMVVAFVIIYLGLRLIRGPRTIKNDDDFADFKVENTTMNKSKED